MNRQRSVSIGKKLKYNYLTNSLHHSLHKMYCSPQSKSKSFIYGPKNSIQRFSPYRNIEQQHIEIKNSLIQQIINQNQILHHQVNQYRTIITKIQSDLNSKNELLQVIEQTLSTDRIYHEQLVNQMRRQIEVVLSKNTILEGQMKKIADLRTKERLLTDSLKEDQYNLRQTISQIIINHHNNHQQKLSTNTNQLKSVTQIKQFIKNILQTNNTLEQFTKSIMEMHRKIESVHHQDLKGLWKWLKNIGQQHNYLKKIKEPLSKYLRLNKEQTIQQMIDWLLVHQLKVIF